ncbi:hypothetical protein FOCC_FOCC008542 [Frankliniella occidentalis]|nr:hypothetical protein FOCC_FOCC008542 [Frankliniella occidentalis]
MCYCPRQNCSTTTTIAPETDWLENEVVAGVKRWHILFMVVGAFCSLVIALCCCIRFRIPRTKQEIEADYVRKQITRKFQKQLRRIRNADMDDMDLKRVKATLITVNRELCPLLALEKSTKFRIEAHDVSLSIPSQCMTTFLIQLR